MEPSPGAAPPSPGRAFRIATIAYVLVVLAMLRLSSTTGEWFLLAEIATLPAGLGWFTGGLLILAVVADELGRAGVLLVYAAFAVAAVVNAVVLRAVFRFVKLRGKHGRRRV